MPVPGSSIELHHKGHLSGKMFWSVGILAPTLNSKGGLGKLEGTDRVNGLDLIWGIFILRGSYNSE